MAYLYKKKLKSGFTYILVLKDHATNHLKSKSLATSNKKIADQILSKVKGELEKFLGTPYLFIFIFSFLLRFFSESMHPINRSRCSTNCSLPDGRPTAQLSSNSTLFLLSFFEN